MFRGVVKGFSAQVVRALRGSQGRVQSEESNNQNIGFDRYIAEIYIVSFLSQASS